jgi:N6-L-threonylcarbamoyladenine synthase
LIEESLKNNPLPNAIAVTSGPGLITGLIIGVEAARTLSYALNIPLLSINHIEGHIYSVELCGEKIEYPALALIASGGHTELIYIKNHGEYVLVGKTKDDASGECFDKVAKLLGLPYPGGPKISEFGATGKTNAIDFPRPMLKENNFNFSFAGLKTSALYWLRDNKEKTNINDFCASFEQAIIDTLTTKSLNAAIKYNPRTFILAGGVSANKKLRETLQKKITDRMPETKFLFPKQNYCMDNAAMIAVAGYYNSLNKNFTQWENIKANPQWELAE